MGRPNLDFVRRGLVIARDRGFAEVEMESDGIQFCAVLEPVAKKPSPKSAASTQTQEEPSAPPLAEIKAPLVGFFQPSSTPMEVGSEVKSGQIVGSIVALGLANEVEASVSGMVEEVLVGANDPVMFGQVLARVKA